MSKSEGVSVGSNVARAVMRIEYERDLLLIALESLIQSIDNQDFSTKILDSSKKTVSGIRDYEKKKAFGEQNIYKI